MLEMLTSLGINSTVLAQFIIFILVFTYLTIFVFTPYAKAVDTREAQTKGSAQIADEYQKKSIELHSDYETKVREIHSHIQDIYKKIKMEANQEYEKIVQEAKTEASRKNENSRKALQSAMLAAQSDLKAQTTSISMSITNKLLGK